MAEVARLYHEHGVRQTVIAQTLHLSQARVSRLLKRAVEEGVVRTVVVVAPGVHPYLESALEHRFGLAEAVVVDAHDDQQNVLAALGSAGASYLENVLTGPERLGISSWSATLLAVTERIRRLRMPGATSVVQLVGGVGVPLVQAQANRLLTELGQAIGANPTFVPAPGLVASAETRESLMNDPAMQMVVADWQRLTMAVVGVGTLQPSRLLHESGNAGTSEERRSLRAAGAVGDVCHRFFDAAGNLVDSGLNERVVGIAPEAYRAIPHRVGIAGGLHKREALRAAALGGWVNVLVTDVATAKALLV